MRLNYHHLYYFWQVARSGNLTKTAQSLHISQSALSHQIKQLEESMNVSLFNRVGRQLALTEAGQQTLLIANDIFAKGEELESLLRHGKLSGSQILRVGMVSTMSRNFIESFISPILQKQNIRFQLNSASISTLLRQLANHHLDIVLSNMNIAANTDHLWQVQLLSRQPISIVGPKKRKSSKTFPDGFEKYRWVLPSTQNEIRSSFDAFCSMWQFQPDIQAEVDDMAMLRLLARDSGALAVLPKVVVKDEISNGILVEYLTIPNSFENFYAITVKKSIYPDIFPELLSRHVSM